MTRRRKRRETSSALTSRHLRDFVLGPMIVKSVKLLEVCAPTSVYAQGGGESDDVTDQMAIGKVRTVQAVFELSQKDLNFLRTTPESQMIIRVKLVNGTETRPQAGHVVPPEDPKSLLKEVRNGES